MKYDFITNVYIEYYLRKLKSFEYEYKKLGLIGEDFQRIVSFQKIQLSQNSKIKVITNIVNLFLMKLDKGNNNLEINKELLNHFDNRFANQNISLEGLIKGTEIVVVGNNIQLICNNEEAKSFYELLFYSSGNGGFNSDTKLLLLGGDLSFSIILQQNYVSHFNQDEQAHEFWHASDKFRSSLFGELFGTEKKVLYSLQEKGFQGMKLEANALKLMMIDLDEILSSDLRDLVIEDINNFANQAKLQYELPAFIFGAIKKSGKQTISDIDNQEITRILIHSYLFSKNILEFIDKFQTGARDIVLEGFIKGFMKVFGVKIMDCIDQFNVLSELKGNGTQALVELGLLPLKGWGVYVKRELKKINHT